MITGNTWHHLAKDGSQDFVPRTGHASVYLESQDSLYIYGGFDLNKAMDSLLRYNFTSSTWSKYNPGDKTFVGVSDEINSVGSDSEHPPALYGHAMTTLPDDTGFVLYGGLTSDFEQPSDQLWFFNTTTLTWSLRASFSLTKPPGLSKHSLTMAKGQLYLFGGSLNHGRFSNKMFKMDAEEQWEEVIPDGGKVSDLRVTGHSMVYHEEMDALILFGGIRTDVARFSHLSDLMFRFDLKTKTWAQMKLEQRQKKIEADKKSNFVPPERAFHSAHIMGKNCGLFMF